MEIVIALDVLLSDPSSVKIYTQKGKVYLFAEDIEKLEKYVANEKTPEHIRAKVSLRSVQKYRHLVELIGSDEPIKSKILVTNSLFNKWKYKGFEQIVEHPVIPFEYKGIINIELPFSKSRAELDNLTCGDGLYEHLTFENEYCIIRNTEETLTAIDGTKYAKPVFAYVLRNGRIDSVNLSPSFRSDFFGKLTARNAEQACLMDLLESRASIISVGGGYGVGKSFILSAYAVKEMEKGKRIIYVPNNSSHENTRELGTLPGELLEKELPYMGTIIDILTLQGVRDLVMDGNIEVVPMAVARGRNFENAIIFANEAQNLTKRQVQLLIGRCGEGTKIFFDGDFKQTDSEVFRRDSGIQSLAELRHSEVYGELFGAVKLEKIERSKTANAASFLSEIF